MTHLYIEQNTGLTEEVNSSIISKLYELAISGDLDETSDLKGRLHSSTAKERHVTYLNNNFDELYISADIQYLSFNDPDVEALLKRYIGTDDGVSLLDIQTFVNSGKAFGDAYTNTHTNRSGQFCINNEEKALINSFDELSLFTGVTAIYSSTFNPSRNLTSIQLPSSVDSLDSGAFYNCSSLTSIDLSNIKYLSQDSLRGTGLTGVINLPSIIDFKSGNSYTGSGDTFQGCSSITEVNFGPNLSHFDTNNIFGNCTSLTRVTGLSNITSIPNLTFKGCTNLSYTDIDWSKITTIGQEAFANCTHLDNNYIDLSYVTSLGKNAMSNSNISGVLNLTECLTFAESPFSGCANITEIHAPKCTTANVYTNYSGLLNLEVLDLPIIDTLGYVVKNPKLTTINAPNATKYSSNAGLCRFENCPMLSTLNINFSAVIEIGGWCFDKDHGLDGQYLEFPNVTTIGSGAFTNCGINFVFSGNSMVTLSGDGWFTNYTGTIYVTDALLSSYRNDSNWSTLSGSQLKGISELPTT